MLSCLSCFCLSLLPCIVSCFCAIFVTPCCLRERLPTSRAFALCHIRPYRCHPVTFVRFALDSSRPQSTPAAQQQQQFFGSAQRDQPTHQVRCSRVQTESSPVRFTQRVFGLLFVRTDNASRRSNINLKFRPSVLYCVRCVHSM